MGPNGGKLGLLGATGIGVGAIVGGGILALSGTAFALAGPGAVLAFALNGVIAIITALSFAELATAFPQSGGPYAFARRVVSVGAAFGVGWVVWFASIVAAALYAMGFAAFALDGVRALFGIESMAGGFLQTGLAVLAALAGSVALIRSSGGGGQAMNIGKVVVFGVLILAGLWAWFDTPPETARFTPFLPTGGVGLLQAMGATFIALQGFDLIAAVAGEVERPRYTLPRAMLLSLGVALLVYMPLLIVIVAVGVSDTGPGLVELARANPDTLVAVAAEQFMGAPGYWLVLVAGLLSMISALLANLFAAARIAQAMGRDRALPGILQMVHPESGTPHVALMATASIGAATLLGIGDVSAAGAASSLIFLVAFALTHVLCVVTRRRKPDHPGYRMPGWPWLPLGGAAVCAGLAVYQALAVPAAGAVSVLWLIVGTGAYFTWFRPRAKIVDAAAEGADPDLLELRGRSPLVLVPVANPANATTLASVAADLAPPRVGRILLFTVIDPTRGEADLERALDDATTTMRKSLAATLAANLPIEALTTVGTDPWAAIGRAANTHRVATVMMGLSDLCSPAAARRIEDLANSIASNLVLLRAPADWELRRIRRLLVPIGGKGVHNALRARLLAGLHRENISGIEVDYLRIAAPDTPVERVGQMARTHAELARDESPEVPSRVHIKLSDDVVGAVCEVAQGCDLLVLGLARSSRGERVVGRIANAIVEGTEVPVMLVSAGT